MSCYELNYFILAVFEKKLVELTQRKLDLDYIYWM